MSITSDINTHIASTKNKVMEFGTFTSSFHFTYTRELKDLEPQSRLLAVKCKEIEAARLEAARPSNVDDEDVEKPAVNLMAFIYTSQKEGEDSIYFDIKNVEKDVEITLMGHLAIVDKKGVHRDVVNFERIVLAPGQYPDGRKSLAKYRHEDLKVILIYLS